jgi:hypothetical protein
MLFCITLKESSFFDGDCIAMEIMMASRQIVKKTTPKIANGSKLLKGSAACTMQAVRAKVPKTNKQRNKLN